MDEPVKPACKMKGNRRRFAAPTRQDASLSRQEFRHRPGGISPGEMLSSGQSRFFDATHKKSLDLIFEGRKIGFVALHNLLFGLKRGLPVSHRL